MHPPVFKQANSQANKTETQARVRPRVLTCADVRHGGELHPEVGPTPDRHAADVRHHAGQGAERAHEHQVAHAFLRSANQEMEEIYR